MAKGGLTDDDKKELARLFKESEKKKQEREEKESIYNKLEGRNFEGNYVHSKLIETRRKILNSFNFSPDDLAILDILNNLDFKDKEYYAFFYVNTSFDHKSFVQEEIGLDYAIQGKFLYIFGANILSDIEEESKKVIFYKLARKLFDFMQQALSSSEYHHKETLNHFLSIIGYLGVGAPYEKILLGDNFTMGFNPNKTGNKFCFIIPPYKMEDPLFKEIYDFYYQNITKTILKDSPILKTGVKIENIKQSALLKTGQDSSIKKLEQFIGDYEHQLENKLSNLKKRGGPY